MKDHPNVAATPESFRSLRKAIRMTQPELAVYMGIHTNSVSRYELGTREIRPNVLRHLSLIVEREGMDPEAIARV